ncbi:MAG: FtsW/RodA/SpoVE family cell cycle protein, partial [Pseudomonadota bacterium]
EEYGVVACLAVLGLFAFISVRAFLISLEETDVADRLAIQGLALIFAAQALINMGVNVGLLPAKGMTLPYVSAGGSSHIGISITLGMLLALTRKRLRSARWQDAAPYQAEDGHHMSPGAHVLRRGRVG